MDTDTLFARTERSRLAVVLWLRLLRVHQTISHALIEDLRPRELSLAQFDVLAQVGAAEGITQQSLADRLLVSKGNICQVLDRMEQRGLLVRRQEGRANLLYLTAAGRQVFVRAVPAHDDAIGRQVATLSPTEQRLLLRLLRKMEHGLHGAPVAR